MNIFYNVFLEFVRKLKKNICKMLFKFLEINKNCTKILVENSPHGKVF